MSSNQDLTTPHNTQEKWIIDTDPGVDDSFAILLGLTALGDNLVALSIENGNVGIDTCFINAKKICTIKNKHVPIYKGVSLNLSGIDLNAKRIHGSDGLYELHEYQEFEKHYNEDILKQHENLECPLIDKTSPLKIIEFSHKYKNHLNILAIGPLTNLSIAFMLDPTLPERINNIIIMGGSYTSLGNIKTNVEFNFACDPISSKIVIDNFNKPNNHIVIYPWETCTKHLISKNHTELLEKFDSETSKYCKRIIEKKHSLGELGVYADYGSAVYMVDKNSMKQSIFRYVDISIDSDICSFGQLCLEYDYSVNKNKNHERKKVEIITKLDEEIFYRLFEKMNKD